MSTKKEPLDKPMTLVTLGLIALFCAFVWGWEKHIKAYDKQRLREHARVISNALWTFDLQSPQNYLRLATRLHNYQRLTIFSSLEKEPFIEMAYLEKGFFAKLFAGIGLIRSKRLTVPIIHQNEKIGRLEVVQINKNIYLYLYWLLITVLLWLGARFFLEVLHGKQTLEARVVERTRELQESKENLSVTLNSIGDAVIVTDTKGLVTRLNPSAAAIVGWPAEEATGKPLNEVFHLLQPDTRQPSPCPVQSVLDNNTIVNLSRRTILISREGQEYQIADSAAPIRDAKDAIVGVVLVFRDVGEEAALQERLRQAEKMQAIGQLAGGIAHDFNNMLGGIIGAADLLQHQVQADPVARKYLTILSTAADNAAGLCTKLLMFSRKQIPVLKNIELHQILQDTVSILQGTIDRRIQIETHFEAESSLVCGDPSLLQSAFLNLGINASQAIQNGGTITFSTKIVELFAKDCMQKAFKLEPGRFLEIEVRDTGSGIKPEILSRIFEPFFSTKDKGKGTGLGLAAVFASIQNHKGAISVDSELGFGTSFRINLPLIQADENAAAPAPNAIHSGTGTILLIDDDTTMRETAQAMLESLGYHVLTANDGKQGLSVFKQSRDEIDLVILDMIMPEMDGRDCFAALQQFKPDVRVILASGFAQEEKVQEMQANGLCGLIAKPFRSGPLSQAVTKALNSSRETP
jgi:PAS domain S-box-containing protein